MRTCKGACVEIYKAVKISPSIYKTKQICRVCQRGFEKNIFTRCPCCKHNLSNKPRNSKLKTSYLPSQIHQKRIKLVRTNCERCKTELNMNLRSPKTIQKYCRSCYVIVNRIRSQKRYHSLKLVVA